MCICMCMCMCICICMCISVCNREITHTLLLCGVYICICIHIQKDTHMHVHTRPTQTYVYTYTCVRSRVCAACPFATPCTNTSVRNSWWPLRVPTTSCCIEQRRTRLDGSYLVAHSKLVTWVAENAARYRKPPAPQPKDKAERQPIWPEPQQHFMCGEPSSPPQEISVHL